jgi:glycine dehydrogenase
MEPFMPAKFSPFVARHIGPSEADTDIMLQAVGASSLAALMAQTLPDSIRNTRPLAIGQGLSETAVLAEMRRLANKNQVFTSLIGQGYYGTILPSVIQRNILENPAWYTAYTPYQPEISQGRLEALLNFQTMVAELCALDIANASLLDEATAAAEAMAMAERCCKAKNRTAFFADENLHPQILAVLRTRAEPLGWVLQIGDFDTDMVAENIFGAIFAYPASTGAITDPRAAIARVHAAGGIAIIAADLLSLTLLTPPGELGADIAIGSAQRFGVPMGYGGPHAAFMACRDAYKRSMPGRLVGVSVDARGNAALRLALQTREQHIRREKATSNICTAQVLLAVMASMYAVYHGPDGLTGIARETHAKAARLAFSLEKLGFLQLNKGFFDTILIDAGARQAEILAAARAEKINLRPVGADKIAISADEPMDDAVSDAVLRAFGGTSATVPAGNHIPSALSRHSHFLIHPVFHRYRTETELMRYMRKLADRDLALDRAMIPLGSCTMKLNAATEMTPITWPEFSSLHPFAPADQAIGYAEMFVQLSAWLCDITGYDAISLQPNSGAQGEYAGLLAIRAYHRGRGEAHRVTCLIPASAHGTNPATAQMTGMNVVVVACDADGNIDLLDVAAKAKTYQETLAAAMITYPSTHGVFEEEIVQICEIIHRHGGQVYLDGANLNAQVGLARPGKFGADVSHLNLHKTFCIPHGGGGPGMGPIGVKAHLAPYLPGHPAIDCGTAPAGPVSAAPYGSASILPISYSYIMMMGGSGLQRATEIAILNANYIATKLAPYFPVLYKNNNNRVAHECIIDPRALKDTTGITVDDIAKRLIDYGFHAPTMSFPVPGTLMIEPTESESKTEIDRFIAAMISIRHEIAEIEHGKITAEQSPLRFAPHTVLDLAEENWPRAYSRKTGAFPNQMSAQDKYWSPVNRVDNAHGDRNLICTCPGLDSYAQAAD